jgi:hypothetical protein
LGKAGRNAPLRLVARATDTDGSVASVSLLVDGQELGVMEEHDEYYGYDWSRIQRGRYELVVRATDDQGGTTDSIPVVLYVERGTPSITGLERSEPGEVSFIVTGNEWAPGHVEWSNDLQHWHSLQNISFDGEPVPVTDSDLATGRRFYRIRIEE